MHALVIRLLPLLTLVAVAFPATVSADHEVGDERPANSFPVFHERVRSWVDPWLDISATSIADDHAVWVAFGLYEELLGIRPESCYLDTHAAYSVVAADLRAMGEAASGALMLAEAERVFEDVARAEALAEISREACATWGGEVDEAREEPVQTEVL